MSDGDDTPMQLIVPYDADSSNQLELQNTLQKMGYEVSKEHDSDYQRVYNVYEQPNHTKEMMKERWGSDD